MRKAVGCPHRRLWTAGVLVIITALLAPHAKTAAGQGQWQTLSSALPANLNPVHIALMNNGKVLIVSGSGNDPSNQDLETGVWDPTTDVLVMQAIGWDMFCNNMSVLPDGRVFIAGGTAVYDPFYGEQRTAVFDPGTGAFTDGQAMAHGRWYPTLTSLGDGRVMAFSGLTETGGTNTAVELYTPGVGWSQEYTAAWTPPLYPRQHLLPNGKVVYTGSGTGIGRSIRRLTPGRPSSRTPCIAAAVPTVPPVLLPLTPADNYRARVMIFGGGNPATATTEVIDMSAATPQWQSGPSMSQARIEMNATILPDKRVLVVGGSTNDEDASTASLNADLFDPTAAPMTRTSAGANAFPRLYHSNSLLLPDGRVLLVGGNPTRGTFEPEIELYSPSYLFNADGTAALRPAISAVTPRAIGYGAAFQGTDRHSVD